MSGWSALDICAACGHARALHSAHAGAYEFRCATGCDCAAFVEPESASPRPSATPAKLTIVDAIRSGKPFRRRKWVQTGPTGAGDEHAVELLVTYWWIYPMVFFQRGPDGQGGPGDRSIFRNLATGMIMPLVVDDFVADDWEIMP